MAAWLLPELNIQTEGATSSHHAPHLPLHTSRRKFSARRMEQSTHSILQMAPGQISTAQRRIRRLVFLNQGPPKPQRTYGSETKPSLPAHFLPSDPYDIQLQPISRTVEEPQTVSFRRSPRPEPDPDDSPLSESELESAYGHSKRHEASGVREKKGAEDARDLSTNASTPPRSPGASRVRQLQRGRFMNGLDVADAPVEQHHTHHMPKNKPEVCDEDPISNGSSSHDTTRSSSSKDSDAVPTEPLTNIRNRLKTPKSKHKSVIALRKKQIARAPFFWTRTARLPIGDGFDTSELTTKRAGTGITRRHRMSRPLALGMAVLKLTSGPLPEVEFSTDCPGLELEVIREDKLNSGDIKEEEGPELARRSPSDRHRGPQILSFSDHVLDEMVMQRLSSVSAPKRIYSISSDDESEKDSEEHWNQSELGEDDSNEPEDPETDDETEYSSHNTPPSAQSRADFDSPSSASVADIPSDPPTKHGVTLDFRKSAADSYSRVPFAKRNLMEVDEMILDDPMEDERMENDKLLRFGGAFRITDGQALHNRVEATTSPTRPILRKSKSTLMESNTGLEHTVANTHQNSSRTGVRSLYFPQNGPEAGGSQESSFRYGAGPFRRNTLVDVDDKGNYFANATNMLREPQTARPRIIKQRTSDSRRSSYFEYQVRNSDHEIPETSTAIRETSADDAMDHRNNSQLKRLQKNSDATCSTNLPKTHMDLRTLTRNASVKYGTSSQSARRPSRLPFASPTKAG